MAEDQYALSSSYSPSPSRLVSLRYYGRHEIVPFNDKSVTPIIEKIVSLSEDVVSISKRNPEWLSVKEDLELLAHKLMDEKVPMEKYRLEVISEAIIPYIEEMKARIHVDKSRFMQVKEIVSVLTHDFSSGDNNSASVIHPANVLFTIDRVQNDINGHSMLWESKLSKLLRACSRKQWQPILLDTQSSLRSIGGSLIALGMVEVVGRPVVMLYPVYMVIMQALKLSKEIEMNHNRITVQQYLQIFKIGVYFAFAYLLLTVLAMYTGLGYTCLLIGGGSVLVASNDEFTKQAAPVIAPHMVNIDLMLGQLHRLEGAVVGGGGSAQNGSSSAMRIEESMNLLQGLFQQGMKLIGKDNSNNNNASYTSGSRQSGSNLGHTDSRVEELDENDESIYSTRNSDPVDFSTNGLRFRSKSSGSR